MSGTPYSVHVECLDDVAMGFDASTPYSVSTRAWYGGHVLVNEIARVSALCDSVTA
jgi:hypothetical protein